MASYLKLVGGQELPAYFKILHSLVKGFWLGRLGTTEIKVLIVLLKYIDRDGVCYPSVTLIAQQACVRPRNASRALAKLERLGILRTILGGGRGRTSIRQVLPPCVVAETLAPANTNHVPSPRKTLAPGAAPTTKEQL